MKIGVLTSSRADYGIYLPLLEKIKNDSFFSVEIIAFGTHLSKSHGYTVNDIEKDGYKKIHKISSLLSNDDEQAISTSYGLTVLKFADFWTSNSYDLVLCLGDRFEMSAAVQAGIPFGVKFGHIHGGETTLGAIDNIYRHQISLASVLHFTAADVFTEKLISLLGTDTGVFSVGSISLDDIARFEPIEKKPFYEKFSLPNEEFVLVTFHPETVGAEVNHDYAGEMRVALEKISKELFLVITMPNADTLGSIFREEIIELKSAYPERILLIENFGKVNYFSAMYYAKLLLGNTSSGIIEAASFGKYVVNVGDRQKGRAQSNNIFDTPFKAEAICDSVKKATENGGFRGDNVYYKNGAVSAIIKIIKESYENI
ncbi:UDP-N-acetylglucosamine 2-epimerase [Flavobacterium suzhouense]|uniref:UDP-N-acetylglucosamine 2-epimerase n=1 Tax=Flavobacterium suzhouense TaxID=1529638 RepID=A0ABW5NQD2_9FLAO